LNDDDQSQGESTGFRSDAEYRKTVVDFEERQGRFPVAKGETEPGHDIDSFSHPRGHPDRRLLRRIEVKGRSQPWNKDETMELSSRQFHDAFGQVNDEDIPIGLGFDYWLYVVEVNNEGGHRVIPIQNPARRAAKYEFRGGTWRALAEHADADTDDKPEK